jgi:hypothetical protein
VDNIIQRIMGLLKCLQVSCSNRTSTCVSPSGLW